MLSIDMLIIVCKLAESKPLNQLGKNPLLWPGPACQSSRPRAKVSIPAHSALGTLWTPVGTVPEEPPEQHSGGVCQLAWKQACTTTLRGWISERAVRGSHPILGAGKRRREFQDWKT